MDELHCQHAVGGRECIERLCETDEGACHVMVVFVSWGVLRLEGVAEDEEGQGGARGRAGDSRMRRMAWALSCSLDAPTRSPLRVMAPSLE